MGAADEGAQLHAQQRLLHAAAHLLVGLLAGQMQQALCDAHHISFGAVYVCTWEQLWMQGSSIIRRQHAHAAWRTIQRVQLLLYAGALGQIGIHKGCTCTGVSSELTHKQSTAKD